MTIRQCSSSSGAGNSKNEKPTPLISPTLVITTPFTSGSATVSPHIPFPADHKTLAQQNRISSAVQRDVPQLSSLRGIPTDHNSQHQQRRSPAQFSATPQRNHLSANHQLTTTPRIIVTSDKAILRTANIGTGDSIANATSICRSQNSSHRS